MHWVDSNHRLSDYEARVRSTTPQCSHFSFFLGGGGDWRINIVLALIIAHLDSDCKIITPGNEAIIIICIFHIMHLWPNATARNNHSTATQTCVYIIMIVSARENRGVATGDRDKCPPPPTHFQCSQVPPQKSCLMGNKWPNKYLCSPLPPHENASPQCPAEKNPGNATAWKHNFEW